MSDCDLISIAGGWEGYRVAGTRVVHAGDQKQIEIELVPLSRDGICSNCGQSCGSVHERVKRMVRDLPILDAQTFLIVHRRRLLCPTCGPALEQLSWLAKYSRGTTRLATSVARLCEVLAVKHVAAYLGLSWDQVKEIDKRALKERVGTVDLSNIEVIGMDEFALHKGHRYATVIVEPNRKEVLWIGKGRSREGIRPFFNLLGHERCKHLKAVVLDMNASYEEEIKEHAPQAKIIYDLFHVVAKYGRGHRPCPRGRGESAERR